MAEKVNKIEEQELETVKEQTGKLQQCVLDLGSLEVKKAEVMNCLLYTSPSPRDQRGSRMPSSA